MNIADTGIDPSPLVFFSGAIRRKLAGRAETHLLPSAQMTRLLSILDRLGDVGDADLWLTRQIRDRARNFQHSGVAASREAERSRCAARAR